MSKAPWTPGPWRACKDGACVCGHIWAEGDKHVATVHENTRDGDGTVHAEWSREERVANARLIAAAPDLLALAERIAAWEVNLVLEGEWRDGLPRFTQSLYDEWMELQALRNAVIAKAKGEFA